ncbi:VENN motif pre-toxin domain-containing protein [Cronobacter condimenti]|uniref:VENN motif pre-toxin domain-containing protein n=1 Tax=Cronobacter condimenti TaxID=1163710 RepID=UPI001F2C3DC2|nr:VENN motif pre-toxin domain-containing protein [Cronobacter condimenti]
MCAAGGSMAAGNSTGISSGANAARVEVENNYLSGKEPETFAKKLADCGNDGGCRADVMKEMVETSNKNIDEFSDCMKAGNKACVDNQLNDIANATGFDALTAEIGTDAVNAYKDGMGVEVFNNAIDCMGMGWEACSIRKAGSWSSRVRGY